MVTFSPMMMTRKASVENLGSELIGVPNPYGNNIITDNGDGTFTIETVDNLSGCYYGLGTLTENASYKIEFEIISYDGVIDTDVEKILIDYMSNSELYLSDGLILDGIAIKDNTMNSYFRVREMDIGSTVVFSMSLKEIL